MERPKIEGLAGRVRRFREALGWTQAELARRAGTHQTSIAKAEMAERGMSLELAVRLADALGILVTDLLPDRPQPPSRQAVLTAAKNLGKSGD